MKLKGNFDGAIGSYEKFLQYLAPLRNILTIPMLIIGLEPPESFFINKTTRKVTEMSEFIVDKGYVINSIRSVMNSFHTDYQEAVGMQINETRCIMALKDDKNRIAVLSYPPDGKCLLSSFESQGWYIIELDSIKTEKNLRGILSHLEDILIGGK